MVKVLFICKRGLSYSDAGSGFMRRLSGLFNSTSFIADALDCAKVIEVQDNNCIDREIVKYRPKLVIIEALWVVPEKFDILKKLHPGVKFAIHLHSNMPFLANEGIAMEWLPKYHTRGIMLIANSEEAYQGLNAIFRNGVVYLPNIYPARFEKHEFMSHRPVIDVGCFGAIRPMKNHLTQALAAIKFAKRERKYLRFHINSSRIEGKGESVLKNLRALFISERHAQLMEHDWKPHNELLRLMRQMDVGMQVSLSETFNIVTADMVSCGVPVVTSPEVRWVSGWNHADPASVDDIAQKLHFVWQSRFLVWINQIYLQRHSRQAERMWHRYIENTI